MKKTAKNLILCLTAWSMVVQNSLAVQPVVVGRADEAKKPAVLGGGRPVTLQQIPAGSGLRKNLEKLPGPAQTRALRWLQSFPFAPEDAKHLRTTDKGDVFYVCEAVPAPSGEATNGVANGETGAAPLPVAPFPNSLKFHSKPGATNVLYLDFDGETVANTAWNNGATDVYYAVSYSLDTDFTTYSDEDQANIKSCWLRVAEDFAPFDVDVTTERPAVMTSSTAHALITRSTDATGKYNPFGSTSGGVAFVNVFGWSDFWRYSPAWVFYDNGGYYGYSIAEVTSHELGHNLGLSHDGNTDGLAYYWGHNSDTGFWAPIMGASYNGNASTWSKGDYYHANNLEDDLYILQTKMGNRADEDLGAPYPSTARPLVITGSNVVSSSDRLAEPNNTNTVNRGVIGVYDMDFFHFTAPAGGVDLTISPFQYTNDVDSSHRGGNMDIEAQLLDADRRVLATSNPVDGMAARIRAQVPAGSYYLQIRGVGVGRPMDPTPSGYTEYASIGQYFVNGRLGTELTFNSDYNSMTVAGTFNGWNQAANNMVKVADYTWQADLTLNNASAVRLKFVANSSWSINWGESNQSDKDLPIESQTAESGNADILVNGTLNGTYRFTFNERTHAYSVAYLPPADTDGDGMPDAWETQYGLNPNSAADASLDPDNDGFTNLREYQRGSNPLVYNAKASAYTSMTVVGVHNGWNAALNNMVLVDDYLWQADLSISSSAFRFKFAANGGWSVNFGESNQTDRDLPVFGTAEAGNQDIYVNGTLNGAYRFLFNEQTKTYSVTVVPPVDNDADGLPDSWEQQYFGNLNQGPNDDPDADGKTNLQEYQNGTNPTVANFASAYTAMGLPGTFNGWSPAAAPMRMIADHTWEYRGTMSNVSGLQFKFAANNAWVSNWGESNQSDLDLPIAGQTAEAGAGNIRVNGTVTGDFRVTFNEQTRQYTVELVVQDADGDGMPDSWENQYGLNPNNASDARHDNDSDGFWNFYEYRNGTSPLSWNLITGNYSSMGIPGSFNSWSPSGLMMKLVDNHLWHASLFLGGTYQFKFAANGGWAANWGDNNQPGTTTPINGTAESFGANITATLAFAEFFFNDQTLQYTVLSQ